LRLGTTNAGAPCLDFETWAQQLFGPHHHKNKKAGIKDPGLS